MTELETPTEAETEDFTDELSDEAIDSGEGKFTFVTSCGALCR